MFYYGSFVELLEVSRRVLENEIMDTVLQQLQHHLEFRRRDDLARQK